MPKRKFIIVLLLSFLYSIFSIIGLSFLISDSFKFIENHLFLNIFIFLILIIIFYFFLNFLFKKLDNNKKINFKLEKFKNTKIFKLFNKHPFLFSLIVILICWLPYIIAYYPAILSPDPSYQIKQFFHIPNKYSDYAIMLDPKVTITNHHPVIHTLLLGGWVKLGTLINNVNLGLFGYSIMQILILSSVLAYTIKFLKKQKINDTYLFLILLIYSFVPVFPFYGMSAVKDVIFGSLIILYIITIFNLSKSKEIRSIDILKTIALCILLILFRNNGFHVIFLSFPFLFFLPQNFKTRLKLIIIYILIISFNFTYNQVILPYFKITPSSVRETLSIPFQQTARYVKEHDKEISEEEKKIIDKVLVYDTLKTRYNSNLADPVKNKFNKYATKEDLNKYFKVWFQEFKNHPKTYIEATISNTYGYYFPLKTNWVIYYKYDTRIVKDGFNYHYNNLSILRKILFGYGVSFLYLPVLGLLINIGFNVWLLLFMFTYLIYKKQYSKIAYLIPSFILVLVCLASPANCYFRYALPFIFALPLNFGLFLKSCQKI